jgi:hypothetical protein
MAKPLRIATKIDAAGPVWSRVPVFGTWDQFTIMHRNGKGAGSGPASLSATFADRQSEKAGTQIQTISCDEQPDGQDGAAKLRNGLD